MSFSRRLFTFSSVIVVVLILAGAVYLKLSGSGGPDSGEGTTDSTEAPEISATGSFATNVAIPVEGVMVVRDTLVISVSAAAQSAAERQVRILAQVEGRVLAVRVAENDPVGRGRLLILVDTTEYALAVARAEANLASAQADYRERTLFDDRIEDPRIREERERAARAKSGLDEAEVALQEAQFKAERTRIRAPFAGRVASLRVVPGQTVRPGDELLTVIDLDPIKVEVQVLESEVGLLAVGRRASISFAAFPGETFLGRIATINPLVDSTTRTAKVTVAVPNPEGRILPGMYARVSLEARKFAERVLVPRAAVLERDRRTMLFVFEGEGRTGLAKWRYVTTGLANDSLVEIVPNRTTDMVEPGEWVLVDGHYTLIHDARVRMVPNVRDAGGRPQ